MTVITVQRGILQICYVSFRSENNSVSHTVFLSCIISSTVHGMKLQFFSYFLYIYMYVCICLDLIKRTSRNFQQQSHLRLVHYLTILVFFKFFFNDPFSSKIPLKAAVDQKHVIICCFRWSVNFQVSFWPPAAKFSRRHH